MIPIKNNSSKALTLSILLITSIIMFSTSTIALDDASYSFEAETGLTPSGDNSELEITGLDANTEYTIYKIHDDDYGGETEVGTFDSGSTGLIQEQYNFDHENPTPTQFTDEGFQHKIVNEDTEEEEYFYISYGLYLHHLDTFNYAEYENAWTRWTDESSSASLGVDNNELFFDPDDDNWGSGYDIPIKMDQEVWLETAGDDWHDDLYIGIAEERGTDISNANNDDETAYADGLEGGEEIKILHEDSEWIVEVDGEEAQTLQYEDEVYLHVGSDTTFGEIRINYYAWIDSTESDNYAFGDDGIVYDYQEEYYLNDLLLLEDGSTGLEWKADEGDYQTAPNEEYTTLEARTTESNILESAFVSTSEFPYNININSPEAGDRYNVSDLDDAINNDIVNLDYTIDGAEGETYQRYYQHPNGTWIEGGGLTIGDDDYENSIDYYPFEDISPFDTLGHWNFAVVISDDSSQTPEDPETDPDQFMQEVDFTIRPNWDFTLGSPSEGASYYVAGDELSVLHNIDVNIPFDTRMELYIDDEERYSVDLEEEGINNIAEEIDVNIGEHEHYWRFLDTETDSTYTEDTETRFYEVEEVDFTFTPNYPEDSSTIEGGTESINYNFTLEGDINVENAELQVISHEYGTSTTTGVEDYSTEDGEKEYNVEIDHTEFSFPFGSSYLDGEYSWRMRGDSEDLGEENESEFFETSSSSFEVLGEKEAVTTLIAPEDGELFEDVPSQVDFEAEVETDEDHEYQISIVVDDETIFSEFNVSGEQTIEHSELFTERGEYEWRIDIIHEGETEFISERRTFYIGEDSDLGLLSRIATRISDALGVEYNTFLTSFAVILTLIVSGLMAYRVGQEDTFATSVMVLFGFFAIIEWLPRGTTLAIIIAIGLYLSWKFYE